ncbi:MAG: thiolase family protein [Candidatus Omnitrophota bacterium]
MDLKMNESRLKEEIVIVDGLRTPIGSPYKSLKKFKAAELAAFVIQAVIKRNNINAGDIDEVILGNVVSAGLGQNMARQAAIWAGIPAKARAITINNVCGAGLESLILGARSILVGDANLVLCGGSESATHNPFFAERDLEQNFNPHDFKDSLIQDGLTCGIIKKHMGELVEILAKNNKISRKEQDLFALSSHLKATKAQQENCFEGEVVPIKISPKNVLKTDDRPRKKISIDNFQTLKTAFVRTGTVTAGNASSPSDGAAICLLANKVTAGRLKLRPKARLIKYLSIGYDPKHAFEAAIHAVNQILEKADLRLKDIDLFEVAESFAAQSLLVQKKLNIPSERLNVYGGDLAFGHPLGAAGARILVTLIHALRSKGLKRGLAVIAYGGGGATAVIVEVV